MFDMFINTALSVGNYSEILLRWSQLGLQQNAGLGEVGLDGGFTPYCSTAQAARDILVTTYSWIITDGGSTPCFTISYTPGLNATLIGQGTQTVIAGEDSDEVEVIPDAGYRFVKWSDESTQNPRTDLAVGANLAVSAIVEADPSGGSSATRVGDRLKNTLSTSTAPITTTTSTPAVTSTDSLLDSVAALIDRLQGTEQELKNLPPEEKQKLILLLQAVVVQLLALLSSL
jgi:Divergent InlB B-repeat domain